MSTIPLSNSDKEAIVDDADFEWLAKWEWRLHDSGKGFLYVARGGGNSKVYMHRLIRGFPKLLVDHRDRNGLNNQRSNLRLSSQSQNRWNTAPRHRNTRRAKSKYLGVSWDGLRSKWKAYVATAYKTHWLGRFDSEMQAARIRDAKAFELHGEFAALNFPLGAFAKAAATKM